VRLILLRTWMCSYLACNVILFSLSSCQSTNKDSLVGTWIDHRPESRVEIVQIRDSLDVLLVDLRGVTFRPMVSGLSLSGEHPGVGVVRAQLSNDTIELSVNGQELLLRRVDHRALDPILGHWRVAREEGAFGELEFVKSSQGGYSLVSTHVDGSSVFNILPLPAKSFGLSARVDFIARNPSRQFWTGVVFNNKNTADTLTYFGLVYTRID
jgi:hypothetical protein